MFAKYKHITKFFETVVINEGMTDAQFKKLDKMLDEGVRFTLKR